MKSLLKKILPPRIVDKINEYRLLVDAKLVKLCALNRFSASLYYVLFNRQFAREHYSVLHGRLAYKASLSSISASHPLLRRNTHRIEKGLIMQPRKAVFAEGYITETVNIFSDCAHQEVFCRDELKWAFDVLSTYFDVVEHTDVIKKAYQKFNSIPKLILGEELEAQSTPYIANVRPQTTVSPEALFQLYKRRRSVRWFEPKAVPMNIIEQAVEMAAQAPSACNRQPFSFFTTVEQQVAAEISSIPMGTKGFSENIPALIVVMGDLSAYPYERDRHVIYIDGGLVSMQLMLAFESLGLSTCPINWPDIEPYEKALAKRLNLKPFQRPIMMMAVGYAQEEGGVPYSQKKTAQQLIQEIS